MKERGEIAAELKEIHGAEIEGSIRELYRDELAAVGVALSYFDCGCVLLQCFDEMGELIGNPKTLEATDSCSADHTKGSRKIGPTAVYKSIFWRDSSEEFDRKHGNEKRIDIAGKLFPPQAEE